LINKPKHAAVKSYKIKIVAEIENCALLGYLAASSVNFLAGFSGQIPQEILEAWGWGQ